MDALFNRGRFVSYGASSLEVREATASFTLLLQMISEMFSPMKAGVKCQTDDQPLLTCIPIVSTEFVSFVSWRIWRSGRQEADWVLHPLHMRRIFLWEGIEDGMFVISFKRTPVACIHRSVL